MFNPEKMSYSGAQESLLQPEKKKADLKETKEDTKKEIEESKKGSEVEKIKKFESYLVSLVGAERVNEIKEKAKENLGVSINSELLLDRYPYKDFVGKSREEAKNLLKEKLAYASDSERERLEPFLKKPNDKLQAALEENERKYLEFSRNREKALAQFIKSGIKNIRLNPWNSNSWLNWENVERGKSGEFQIDPKAEEIIDRLAEAKKNIDLVIPFANKNYFGKENRANIPSTPEQVEVYTKFCGFLAEHFKGKINQFEISSEPNVKPKELMLGGAFPNNPEAKLYGEVAGRAAEIIKRNNPQAEIIFGNVALFDPEFIKNGLAEVKRYEEELKKEEKLKPHQHLVDYVGFHPYRRNPEAPSSCIEKGKAQFTKEQEEAARKEWGYKSYEDQLEIYRRIVNEYSSQTKLIDTEVGWQVGKEGPNRVADEKAQGEYLLKAAAIDASHGISSTFFELFELARGRKYSLLNGKNQPKEGLKNLEGFNEYLEYLKKSIEEKKKM